MRRVGLAAFVLGTGALRAAAQASAADSVARCDSIIAAARVGSVSRGLFIAAARVDGGDLPPGDAEVIATSVGTSFEVPRPLHMVVFDGAPQMSKLRRRTGDTVAVPRAPRVTGVYRFTATTTQPIAHLEIVRASLVSDLDRAMVAAIRTASGIDGVIRVPEDEDSMRVEIRLSNDSTAGARRVVTVRVPTMPVIDAVPFPDNPPAQFPATETEDTTGDVVLRFVVGRDGLPNHLTIEIERARSLEFVRSAFAVLDAQGFIPATIRGCPVAQVISYPFTFARSTSQKPPRH
jgi:Gram-negative bacterial tonB protein.